MHEKEKVYEELHALRKRVFELRKQVRGLHKAHSHSEAAKLRQERDRLKTALSWIGHSPYAPDDAEELKYAARLVLLDKAYTIGQRRRNRVAAQTPDPSLAASRETERRSDA